MQSDPTAAAERLRQYAESILNRIVKSESNAGRVHSYALLQDRQAYGLVEPYELAVAYLAEHDPTPIDEAWLRSVGFGEHDGFGYLALCHERLWMQVVCVNKPWDGVELVADGREVEDGTLVLYSEKQSLTRGQLRRLAAVLGVTLKEERNGKSEA